MKMLMVAFLFLMLILGILGFVFCKKSKKKEAQIGGSGGGEDTRPSDPTTVTNM